MKRTIYRNANVITMEDGEKRAQAFLVEDGLFRAVGNDEEIMALADDTTEIEDLNGRTVLPGFFETHMHILSEGMLLRDINHNSCDSIENLIEHSKKYIADKNVPAGTWVRGRGWNQDNFKDEPRFINRWDLDKVSTEHPLAFMRTCGHVIVTNTKALELMGMTDSAPDVPGGVIDKDENGVPLGIFREKARNCVWDAIPEESLENVKELICLASEEALKNGIVEIQSDDFKDVHSNFDKVIQAYDELIAENKLKIRVYEQCNLPAVERIKAFLAKGYHTGYSKNELYTLGPLKLLSDGALGARTAFMNSDYADKPGERGILLFTREELNEMVGICHKAGMQVAIHAIGEGAVDVVLDAIELAKNECPRTGERHGIIHCQITNDKQLDRMKAMDLIGYIQPIFLNYDIDIVEDRVGPERAATAYNWKDFIDKGIHVAGGSDCPVESLCIMENIYAAVTRKNLKGKPEGGWKPEQDLTVEQAIKLFTIDGAYASFREDRCGSIKAGKSADFVVIDEDIMSVPEDTIKDIKIKRTYLKGNLAYKA